MSRFASHSRKFNIVPSQINAPINELDFSFQININFGAQAVVRDVMKKLEGEGFKSWFD